MNVKSIARTVVMSFLEPLLPLLKPFVKGIITSYIFEPLLEKDKQLHDNVVTSLYGPIDVYAEEAASKTKTKIDDFAVEVVMEVFEESAERSGIELPNLDED